MASRGLTRESVERFRLGYAPMERGWLLAHGRRRRFGLDLLEQAGLAARAPETAGLLARALPRATDLPDSRRSRAGHRFRRPGLARGRTKAGRPGKHVAKYLNSPETLLFHKRTILYGADLARTASREAGWVAVVEGYTDVIAAHQVGLANVVGTLGTALGEDHLRALRRLADRVVLVFDGDQAGQSAADRALELFLASELDLRVLTLAGEPGPLRLPSERRGRGVPRALPSGRPIPLSHLLARAAARFDLDSGEGSRRAAEWVLGTLNRMPETLSSTWGSRSSRPRSSTTCRTGCTCHSRPSPACAESCGARPIASGPLSESARKPLPVPATLRLSLRASVPRRLSPRRFARVSSIELTSS